MSIIEHVGGETAHHLFQDLDRRVRLMREASFAGLTAAHRQYDDTLRALNGRMVEDEGGDGGDFTVSYGPAGNKRAVEAEQRLVASIREYGWARECWLATEAALREVEKRMLSDFGPEGSDPYTRSEYYLGQTRALWAEFWRLRSDHSAPPEVVSHANYGLGPAYSLEPR